MKLFNVKLFNQKQLVIALTSMGTLLLVLGCVLVIMDAQLSFLPMGLEQVLHFYAALLGSFVSGMQWSIHFCKRTSDSVYLLSSLCVLLLCLSFIWFGEAVGFALLLVSFVLLWVEEYRLSRQRVTTLWFWRLRNAVSAISVLSLVLVIFI
ncbi:MAG: DUF3429 domain-containing protein [Pseudomonadales bacterium]|jgi:hypothetical protein|nr:DUF3429 domain-containing protein [Pseudomonadales bacterium]